MSINNASFVPMEEEETPRPHIKRRSTFYRRRSVVQVHSKDESQNTCNEEAPATSNVDKIEYMVGSKSRDEKNDVVPLDLEKYIDNLQQERKKWIETLRKRKRQRKIIMKQISNKDGSKQELDLRALSETERNFLLIRPNYEHICEKAKKLSVMAMETLILNQHIVHLHRQCMLRAEKKLDILTKRIIKLVD